jgi:misacylated tRNA(Ala) deacylase
MTVRLYYEDSYLKTFTAEITRVDQDLHGIILDQTIFYPGGGGQPTDKGFFNIDDEIIQLQGFKTIQSDIVHILPKDIPLPAAGTKIIGEIDWDYRYSLMRTHTAMHVLCGVIFRDYGASVTGGNMSPYKGRMDFEFASLHGDLVSVIEDAVNQEISKSLSVTWEEIPRSEAIKIPDLIRTKINLVPKSIKHIRVVEIESLDLQADGGTHVRNTEEVKPIKITDYKSKGKENKRIYLELSEK